MTSDSFVPGDVPHCHPSPQLSDMHPEPSPVCQDSGGPTQGGPEAPSTTGGAPPKALPPPPTAVRDPDGNIGVQPPGPQAGGEGGSKLGRGRGSAWCLHTLGPSTSALSSHGSWKVFGLILWCRGMQGVGEPGSGRGSSR